MLRFLLRPFFSTILIGVNLDGKVCSLQIVVMKNNKVKNTINKEFKIVDKQQSSLKAINVNTPSLILVQ